MKWKPDLPAADNAKAQLPKLVAQYFDAGREAVKKQRSPRQLHKFRVETKRFRYALEMFRPVYGPELEGQLETLRELQKILGKISDTYTVRKLLKNDGSYAKDLHRKGRKQIREFREYWTETFDAPDKLKEWKAALRSPSVPRPARKPNARSIAAVADSAAR